MLASWGLALDASLAILYPHIKDTAHDEAKAAIEAWKISQLTLFFVSALIIGYLRFLSYLPELIRDESQKGEEN